MKHTASNLFQRLVGMMVVLTLAVSTTAISAHAASSAGIYTATASAHYRNPSTGRSRTPAEKNPRCWVSP